MARMAEVSLLVEQTMIGGMSRDGPRQDGGGEPRWEKQEAGMSWNGQGQEGGDVPGWEHL
jgi:hypothetical protein